MNSLQLACIACFLVICCMASYEFEDYSMDEFDEEYANVASTSQYCRFGKKSLVSLPAATTYEARCKHFQQPRVVQYINERKYKGFCGDKPFECSFGTTLTVEGDEYSFSVYCTAATECSELQPGTYRSLNDKTCMPPCPSAFPVSCYGRNMADVCATSEDACKRVKYGAFPECK